MFPISQVRYPQSVVKYLAHRIPLITHLKLTLPSEYDEWSALAICEAFAIQKGFFTAKGSRPDTYRAANLILRNALDGKILLSWKPPGFFQSLLGKGESMNDMITYDEETNTDESEELDCSNTFSSLPLQ
jgi:ribosome biogenesis GTPase A